MDAQGEAPAAAEREGRLLKCAELQSGVQQQCEAARAAIKASYSVCQGLLCMTDPSVSPSLASSIEVLRSHDSHHPTNLGAERGLPHDRCL